MRLKRQKSYLPLEQYVDCLWQTSQRTRQSFEIKELQVDALPAVCSSSNVFTTIPKLIVGSTVSIS
jgi:hypothetical protein